MLEVLAGMFHKRHTVHAWCTAVITHADGIVMTAANFGHPDAVMLLYAVSGFRCMLFRWMRMRRFPLGTRPPRHPPSQSWRCRRASAAALGLALHGWTMSPPLVMSVTLPLTCTCCCWCPMSVASGRSNFLPVNYVRTDSCLPVQSSYHHLLPHACII